LLGQTRGVGVVEDRHVPPAERSAVDVVDVVPIQVLSTLAAVRTTPWVMTPG
jgi:hypothetical protein